MDSHEMLISALSSNALKDPISNLLNPVAKSAGETLADIWDIAFGSIHTYAQKKAIERAHAIEEFKKRLVEDISAIPTKNLEEPPLSVVGPAMEAAKYHFEVPELRNMFAALIASSMDSAKSSHVHPSFVEILKQMDSYDAYNFSLFSNLTLPSAQYKVVYKTKQTEFFIYDFIADGMPADNEERMGASISSLERLGLIHIERDTFQTPDHSPFFDCAFIQRQTKELSADPDFQRICAVCGIASLTPIGKSLYETCIRGD